MNSGIGKKVPKHATRGGREIGGEEQRNNLSRIMVAIFVVVAVAVIMAAVVSLESALPMEYFR